MKITIDDKEYELNVEEAVKRKLLIPIKKITSFDVGDVFASSNHAQVVVVKPIWYYSNINTAQDKVYGFVGNHGDLFPYSNHKELLTYDGVLTYLNKNELEYKGNISQVVNNALAELCGSEFCG